MGEEQTDIEGIVIEEENGDKVILSEIDQLDMSDSCVDTPSFVVSKIVKQYKSYLKLVNK